MTEHQSTVHLCPACRQEWDEKDLDWKRRKARDIVLGRNVGSITGAIFGGLLPPDRPEDYCNLCLREYMRIDQIFGDQDSDELEG